MGKRDISNRPYRVSSMFGDLHPVIGVPIPKRLASRLGLDLNHARIQKDGQEGQVMVGGRCNGGWDDFRVPLEELNLKASQKKRLGITS